ncbi:DMT family transporter [Auritidibacter sp. NML100628]|uniref:EamA family transporter n=1 Tax=Auritidibacter sp. NML100628 TaxID=2170742 RepID=UPI000D735E35|nr:DMT family transporter [Auritidibacter sp. NML100628]PXA75466.1 EamA family transporter [Auritidibacter sp. NML100628]
MPVSPRNDAVRPSGILMVLGSCSSLQFGATVAMQLFPAIGSWGTTTVRLALACVILLLVLRPRFWGWTKTQWTSVIWFGLALGGMNGFFYSAIDKIPLGVAVALEFTGPLVLSAIMSRARRDLIFVGAAALGMVLLGVESSFGAASFDPLGVAFALIAGGFWAFYIIFSARTGQLVPGGGGLAVAMGIGALVVLIPGAPGVAETAVRPELWLLVLGTALLSSVVPYSLELAALRRIPTPVFSILLSLEPVVAAVIGWFMLDQTFGWLRAAAFGLVIVASAGITRSQARPRPESFDEEKPVSRHRGGETA